MQRVLGRLAFAVSIMAMLLAGCALPFHQQRLAARPVQVDEVAAAADISRYRQSHGLNAVTYDPALEKAADAQAMAMAQANVLSHTVAGSLEDRLSDNHIPPTAADENISGGYYSLGSALEGWRKSPPHRANLLDPKMRRIGIGSAYAPMAHYHQYWSLILAD